MQNKIYSTARITAMLVIALALVALSVTAAAQADSIIRPVNQTAKVCSALANQAELLAAKKRIQNQYTWITAFGSCAEQQTAAQGVRR
ncbi:MAG: hypothetical protein KDD66_08580 [Bdellovibrionales bacterium]|nr:hypothetical protein [Bdellovibrionales bacterium]